jgi:hypothetical protein
MRIAPWVWLVWFLTFIVLETIALLNDHPNDTLTMTIVRYVPGWGFFAFIGWAIWHWMQAYRTRRGR